MLLSRTRQKIAYHLKAFIFNSGGFQEMLELREKYQLEDRWGFVANLTNIAVSKSHS